MKRKILLVYAALTHPLRATTKHLIDCFKSYSDDHWFYLNIAHKQAPAYFKQVDFDLIIFHTTFTQRLSRSERHFRTMMRRVAPILDLPVARKVALVQDEFWNVAKVEDFLLRAAVDVVFSVSPETAWPQIYPRLDPKTVRFHQVLTGYLDDRTLDYMVRAGEKAAFREIDIVYRAAGRPSPAWGSHGYLKQKFVDAVQRLAPRYALKCDISTSSADTVLGDAWFRFLASARYTLGVESGVSLLDRDGQITACVERHLATHPGAAFEDVEAICFPGQDNKVNMRMLGPRHLEACATRTCQVLIEGHYNGLLEAGVHYISVKPDLSDLSQVLASLDDEDRRQAITERAFRDIVASGKLTYAAFVREVLAISFQAGAGRIERPLTPGESRWLALTKRIDAVEWAVARHLSGPFRRGRNFIQNLRGVSARGPGQTASPGEPRQGAGSP